MLLLFLLVVLLLLVLVLVLLLPLGGIAVMHASTFERFEVRFF
jgi:hypothetical protein